MRVLGMMSGTSVDGIDAALVELDADGSTATCRLQGLVERPFPAGLREEILSVLPPASSDVARWCALDTRIGQAYAETAQHALAELGGADLVVMHGQTLFHWVEDGRVEGTLQSGNPTWVAGATGLPVVSDLRSADVAAGGQGAPLASTLDALWLADEPTAALNLGGIANVTIVGDGDVRCGDTGPASCLLDVVAQHDFGLPYDADGALAAQGTVDQAALARMLDDEFFTRPLPRSTGRELFHQAWLDERLGSDGPTGVDLMATLTELTVRSIADVVVPSGASRLVVAGGGARNGFMMSRLATACGARVCTSDDLGIPTQAKEAVLFALLGWLSVHGQPGVVVGRAGVVTGAREARVLGSLTPPVPLRLDPVGPIRRLVVEEDPS